jgi:hypothetical protein
VGAHEAKFACPPRQRKPRCASRRRAIVPILQGGGSPLFSSPSSSGRA